MNEHYDELNTIAEELPNHSAFAALNRRDRRRFSKMAKDMTKMAKAQEKAKARNEKNMSKLLEVLEEPYKKAVDLTENEKLQVHMDLYQRVKIINEKLEEELAKNERVHGVSRGPGDNGN